MVLGFQQLDPEVHIVGVIANRAGGAGHARLLREAIEAENGIPVLVYVRHSPGNLVTERHLGLVPAAERSVTAQQLAALGQQFGQTCDSEKLFALAREAPPIEQSSQELFSSIETQDERVHIAIAQDEAFNFYYPDTLDLLRLAGADLVPFSPLHGSVLPEHIAGIYIGGGFPEEYAQHLAANASLRSALARLLQKNIPCYAECGGLMYLLSWLLGTSDLKRHFEKRLIREKTGANVELGRAPLAGQGMLCWSARTLPNLSAKFSRVKERMKQAEPKGSTPHC